MIVGLVLQGNQHTKFSISLKAEHVTHGTKRVSVLSGGSSGCQQLGLNLDMICNTLMVSSSPTFPIRFYPVHLTPCTSLRDLIFHLLDLHHLSETLQLQTQDRTGQTTRFILQINGRVIVILQHPIQKLG